MTKFPKQLVQLRVLYNVSRAGGCLGGSKIRCPWSPVVSPCGLPWPGIRGPWSPVVSYGLPSIPVSRMVSRCLPCGLPCGLPYGQDMPTICFKSFGWSTKIIWILWPYETTVLHHIAKISRSNWIFRPYVSGLLTNMTRWMWLCWLYDCFFHFFSAEFIRCLSIPLTIQCYSINLSWGSLRAGNIWTQYPHLSRIFGDTAARRR